MKKWMTAFVFGGLLSTTGFASVEATPAAAPTQAASDDALPCFGCCPPHICGLNGPSFDGTTRAPECTAR